MKGKHRETLKRIYSRPVSANIQWRDIEALFLTLGAEVIERKGSRVEVFLFNQVRVFHRPYPRPTTDKGAVAGIRRWLDENGVTP
ncbi:type II toxin-antitoxin system HicA family toxin [Candidatus Thiosymbion oneisti]|uniref:type II toxin-antitoxin system HicA family toxin n=1 Tax=Candidatus Thiosymbion oneisti TaxID=589554 RepID=UPI00105F803F|nr:type II toxin-antitoxin system HicA family toxin [Candidatus Thiosymbion oneisti]